VGGIIFALSSLLPPFARDYDTVHRAAVRARTHGRYIHSGRVGVHPSQPGATLVDLGPGGVFIPLRVLAEYRRCDRGWYSEAGRWEWIFWQNTVLTPVMMALICLGMPREPINRDLLRQTDWGAIVFAGLGFGLIYAALDQGNRLDWLNSGTVVGLLAGGGCWSLRGSVNEWVVERPLIHLRVLVQRNVFLPAMLVAIYGFGSTRPPSSCRII